MSSAGQAIGGIVGGAIGFMVGGPSMALKGAQIGMMIGGWIDPPPGPVINGPRLEDLSVQTSTYGAMVPRNYGTMAQHGNIFWLKGDALTETPKTTESSAKGGPVTTTNTWDYSATFAVGLCQGPIDGIRRIWIGGQLWYDAGSDDLATIISSNQRSQLFTLYLGTGTQTADPLMQADKGAANVPAYRGLAYIVFEDLPLANYGNSLMSAQVKCEIVKDGVVDQTIVPLASAASSLGPYAIATQGFYAYMAVNNASKVEVYNLANPLEPILVGSASTTGSPVSIAVLDQYVYVANQYGTSLQIFNAANPHAPVLSGSVDSPGNGPFSICISGNRLYMTDQGNHLIKAYNIADRDNPTLLGEASTGTSPRGIAMHDGYACLVNYISNTLQIFNVAASTPVLVGSVATTGNPVSIATRDGFAYVTGYIGNTLQVYDISDPTLPALVGSAGTSLQPISVGVFYDYAVVANFNGENIELFDISSATPVLLDTAIPEGVPAALSTIAEYGLFCVANRTSNSMEVMMFNNYYMAHGTIVLGDIVQAECLASGLLETADIDVTELTDTVRGYRVVQNGAIRGALDPLRAAWPFDVVQHGYQIKFKRRGSASVATIDASELDARAAGESPGVQITDSREMDIMLPRRVSLNYVDAVREYDNNMQPAERINTDAVSDRSIQLPIVLNADEAAQKAETLLYLYWIERYDIAFRLPPTYAHIEPGDVITITSPSAEYEVRLTRTHILPDGRIECAGKYNSSTIYTSTAVGEEGQSGGALLTMAGPSAMALLDIPLLRDDDDTAGFPVAMSGYMTSWPGGVLYRSDDGGQSWSDLQAFAPGAVIGYATSSLSSHGGTMYDLASTLAVRLYSGSLSSVTETQLFSGQNWFAYGADGRWEIIAARVATLQGDGSYILMDFLRGQYGTEWATGLHVANEMIVLLDTAALQFISVNASSIGTARDYRAITVGQSLDSAATQTFTYAGVNLECLSPVNLRGDRDPPTAKWTLYWNRRSRFGGWRDYVNTLLGEASEAYEIDVFSDGTYATVKRTLTSATETVEYSSAHQVADFGSNQATLYLKIYQLSATVGRGYPLTTSISRT